MQEEFKDIPNHKGRYQVSNLGNVKSLPHKRCFSEKILKPSRGSHGYLILNLRKDGKPKTRCIHQLVAEAFLGHVPCGTKIIVDHIDENPLNNRLDNLQLYSSRANTAKALKFKGGTSEYVGVSWAKNANKWISQIYINGKQKQLGYFTDEMEAYDAYEAALIKWESKSIEPKPKRISSKLKGVKWRSHVKKWMASITINGTYEFLGYFTNELEAAKAYQKALSGI